MDKKDKKDFIKRLVGSVIGVVLVLVVVFLLMHLLGWTDLTQEEIQEYVASTGALAPLAFIAMCFLQVTLIPIPAMVMVLAGNYIFGFWKGFLYCYIGMLLGSLFAFALGKLLGRRFVNWIAGSAETVDGWIDRLKGREKILLFFMFLLPIFPDDLLCAVAGLFSLSWTYFLVMQLVTRATSTLSTLVFLTGDVVPFEGWGLIVLALMGIFLLAAFIVCFKYSQQIDDWLTNLGNKIFRRKK